MASTEDTGPLFGFAKDQGLLAGSGSELPRTGSLLSIGDLKVDAAARGELPGGRVGTILHCTWVTRSNDSSTTHRRTAVVLRVPESIGYAPYLMIGRGFGLVVQSPGGGGVRTLEPAHDVRVIADEGIDEGWLTELFSPALGEWLQRSPKDFGAELADGVLVVVRDGHLADAPALSRLCADATKIADAVREESLEESEAGGGAVAKPAAPDRGTVLADALIGKLELARPPAHVESVLGEAQRLAVRSGAVRAWVVRSTLLWMLGINVIGGGIYGLLLTVGDPLTNVLLYQALLLAIVGTSVFRAKTSGVAKAAAQGAFYRRYADSHELRGVEPLRFAAEHADAGLPGKPQRVFEGSFGGKPGHLMLTGDGRERGQQIALVRGVRGPTAATELNVSAPGISTAALDAYVETLVLDLETAPAPPSA